MATKSKSKTGQKASKSGKVTSVKRSSGGRLPKVKGRTSTAETVASPAVRKSVLLGPGAIDDLELTAGRRGTQRAAIEEGLALLAERDRQLDAMGEFVDWAVEQYGRPSEDDYAWADKVLQDHK